MSWNGHPVIDLDAHIVERADRFYGDYIDPAYRDAYQRLCDAVARQTQGGGAYSLFGSRTSIIEPVEAGRPLGVRDTFGLTQRSGMEGGRKAFPPGRADALPPIRPEVSWDVAARLEDMDRGQIDVNVLYPTHVSSYCALRDGRLENALYRAYHRWVADFCGQAPARLKWTIVANMRDVPAGVAEVRYWAERDPNAVGIYISPRRQTASCSTIPICIRCTTSRRRSTCRCSRTAGPRGRRTGRARSTSTARGSCCTASRTRGRGWRRSAR